MVTKADKRKVYPLYDDEGKKIGQVDTEGVIYTPSGQVSNPGKPGGRLNKAHTERLRAAVKVMRKLDEKAKAKEKVAEKEE